MIQLRQEEFTFSICTECTRSSRAAAFHIYILEGKMIHYSNSPKAVGFAGIRKPSACRAWIARMYCLPESISCPSKSDNTLVSLGFISVHRQYPSKSLRPKLLSSRLMMIPPVLSGEVKLQIYFLATFVFEPLQNSLLQRHWKASMGWSSSSKSIE